MNVLESSPYEPFIRGFDYVRLASITAGGCVGNALAPPGAGREGPGCGSSTETGKSFVLPVSTAWLRSSNCFSKEFPLIPVLNCYMFWEKSPCDFCLLAVSLFGCFYEGLGLRDVVQKPLPMTHPRHTRSL